MADGTDRPWTSLDSNVAELNALALGISVDTLMENAGRAVAEEAARRLPKPPAAVAILAGAGNNGGDGTCAAYYLAQWGYRPEIWMVRPASEVASRPARRCLERAERTCPVHPGVPGAPTLRAFPLAVDAMLGTGQRGDLRSPYREAVRALRESGVPVLSIDEATGLDTSEGLRPQWTVALTGPKVGMTPESSGDIIVRDIGIPTEAWRRTGPGDFLRFRTPSEARGRNSRVLVIGGGPYAGAPALAALAALRTGSERATVVAPASSSDRIQGFSPDLIVQSVGRSHFEPVDVSEILAIVEALRPNALIVGMGAGSRTETVEAFRGLLPELPRDSPVVVDADALRALSPETSPGSDRVIATPNEGEYRRTFEPTERDELDARLEESKRLARKWRLSLCVKGTADLLTNGEEAVANTHHHPAMTVGGVGDVLGGTIGSLLGQGLPPLAAARLASYWVGEAGIRVAQSKSFGLLATDVLHELPSVLVSELERVRPARE